MFDVTALYLRRSWCAAGLSLHACGEPAQIAAGQHRNGGHAALELAARVQGNCAEYAPIGLLLLALTEAQGAPSLAVHALGLMLLAGRILHFIGYGRTPATCRCGSRAWY